MIKVISKILLILVLWKIIIILSTFFIASNYPPGHFPWLGSEYFKNTSFFYWVWANFDGRHYLEIADYGYRYPVFAFFPLYSLLIKMTSNLTHLSSLVSGLLVSHLNLFLGLIMFYKLIRLDFDEKFAFRTIIVLITFPVAFYYTVIYADSTYFLLSVTAFYFARKKLWLLASLFAMSAGLSRLIGNVLIFAFIVEWYLQNKYLQTILNTSFPFQLKHIDWKKVFQDQVYWIILAPLGWIIYGSYLQLFYGDFLLFQKSMGAWNQSGIVTPPQVIYRYIIIFNKTRYGFTYLTAVMEFLATFIYSALAIFTFRNIRKSYAILMAFTIIVPIMTGTLQGMPRYVLHMFPAFIAITLILQRYRINFWLYITFSLLLQLILFGLFSNGHFVG